MKSILHVDEWLRAGEKQEQVPMATMPLLNCLGQKAVEVSNKSFSLQSRRLST